MGHLLTLFGPGSQAGGSPPPADFAGDWEEQTPQVWEEVTPVLWEDWGL